MLEPLESRIAPASFSSATAFTFTDEDGDRVTVRFTKPVLTPQNFAAIVQTTASGVGEVLSRLDLSGLTAANGTGIAVTVAVSGDGDGLTNVGDIDATGIDLGSVTVKGDLTSIAAGDATTSNGGLKSLTVTSFGVAATSAGDTPALSRIAGSMGALVVRTDMLGASLDVNAPSAAFGEIASILIGGSLQHGAVADTGYIQARGDIGPVTVRGSVIGETQGSGSIASAEGKLGAVFVGGSVFGGAGDNSGAIFGDAIASVRIVGSLQGGGGKNSGSISAAKIATVFVGGGVTGSDGENSGVIAAETLGNVTVVGALFGGAGNNSGQIFGTTLAAVTIGGSVFGGTGDASGSIGTVGNMGAVKIGGSLIGGGVDNTTFDAGQIWARTGNIASVTIGGSAIAGSAAYNGSILAGGSIGPVKIGQSIFSAGGGVFLIVAKGTVGGNAIASLTVGGSVSSALVLGGFNSAIVANNEFASIGPVKVAGSWTASSIVAGVRNLGDNRVEGGTGLDADNVRFGNANDEAYGTFISKIASISIGGAVSGTPGGNDHYGFVAGQIGSLLIDGTAIPLQPGFGTDDRRLGVTGDFRVHEV